MLVGATDAHSKRPAIIAMENTTAEEIISMLRSLLPSMGLTDQIVTHNWPQFP